MTPEAWTQLGLASTFAGVIVYLWRHYIVERNAIIAECAKDRKAADETLAKERAEFANERATLLASFAKERAELAAKLEAANAERINDNKAVAEKQLGQMREIVRALDSVKSASDMMLVSIDELSDTLRGKVGG